MSFSILCLRYPYCDDVPKSVSAQSHGISSVLRILPPTTCKTLLKTFRKSVVRLKMMMGEWAKQAANEKDEMARSQNQQ